MKKIFFLILSLIVFSSAFSQTGNDTTKYTWYKYTYGNRLQRYWADSVLDIPHDTTFSKYGLARKNGTLYIGNGILWSQVTGGSGTDTATVTNIGSGSPAIPQLFASDGNLRSSNLVPGIFTIPFANADSGVGINLDTAYAAYKSWVIQQFGTSVNNLQQVIDNGSHLTRTDTIYTDGHNLIFYADNGVDSEFHFINKNGVNQNSLEIYPTVWSHVVTDGTTSNSTNVQPGQIAMQSSQGAKFNQMIIAPDSVSLAATNGTTVKLSLKATTARLTGLPQANDSTIYKPLGMASDGLIKRMDGWAGGAGGGGGGTATIQTITSGSSGTVTGSNYWVRFNPASAIAAYTLTLPASPTVGQSVVIYFGGTITSGTVVTSLTVSPNTSQTILDGTPITGSLLTVDNTIEYSYVATNLWQRKKL